MTNVLTRYLYEKTEVKDSLLFALCEGKRNEALFWTVELFESGFVDELAEWIRWIFGIYCAEQYPRFRRYVHSQLSQYATSPDPLCCLASIIANFAHRPYERVDGSPESRVYIQIRRCDIAPYVSSAFDSILPRKRLQYACLYPIRKPESDLFRERAFAERMFDTPKLPRKDADGVDTEWLYYATAETPLWKSRVALYPSFTRNDETQTARFIDEDEAEQFYEMYGLYPDEQPQWVRRLRYET
jgi:hypothetical protein